MKTTTFYVWTVVYDDGTVELDCAQTLAETKEQRRWQATAGGFDLAPAVRVAVPLPDKRKRGAK